MAGLSAASEGREEEGIRGGGPPAVPPGGSSARLHHARSLGRGSPLQGLLIQRQLCVGRQACVPPPHAGDPSTGPQPLQALIFFLCKVGTSKLAQVPRPPALRTEPQERGKMLVEPLQDPPVGLLVGGSPVHLAEVQVLCLGPRFERS